MGKKVQVSISMDQDFLTELNQTIEKHSLPTRSALIQEWASIGFKKLKKELGIPPKQEIAVEISKGY